MSASAVFLLPLVVAFWPVWRWYIERWSDRSDEPLGILALLTALILVWIRNSSSRSAASRSLLWAAVGVAGLYTLIWPWAPQAVQALLAVVAISLCMCGIPGLKMLSPGECSLLILSLPVVSTLNFYFGYPMRLLVTLMASALLKIAGFAVIGTGTEILWGEQIVEVDAPCSGVKMLWFSSYVAATFAGFYALRWTATTRLLVFSILAALFGNVMRVTSLFFLETGILGIAKESNLAEWLHQGIGVTAFVIVAALIVWMAQRIIARTAGSAQQLTGDGSTEAPGKELNLSSCISLLNHERSLKALICASVVAGLIPLLPLRPEGPATALKFPGWPSAFEGSPLVQVETPEDLRRFLTGFPGEIALFDNNGRRIIMRWVTHESRQLHPSSDCYRGLGYAIKLLPLQIGRDEQRWHCFEATRGSDTLLIRETIRDSHGNSWSDVSAWYWQAFMSQSQPPWWVITVVEKKQ